MRWAAQPRCPPLTESSPWSTIQIDQLRKTYGGIVAVDGMDLDVAAGSIHAIVGENGAGKSTLMKVLAGAVRPDSGTISTRR